MTGRKFQGLSLDLHLYKNSRHSNQGTIVDILLTAEYVHPGDLFSLLTTTLTSMVI